MKKSSLRVVVREIVYAARISRRMRSCATKYPDYDNFHHIYSDLASIFEGFGTSFLSVLLFEGDFEAVVDMPENKDVFEFAKDWYKRHRNELELELITRE